MNYPQYYLLSGALICFLLTFLDAASLEAGGGVQAEDGIHIDAVMANVELECDKDLCEQYCKWEKCLSSSASGKCDKVTKICECEGC